MLGLDEAVQVFGRSFALVRSITFPAEFVKVGPIFAVRDATERKRGGRATEFMAVGRSVSEVVEELRDSAPDRYFLCVISPISESLTAVRDAYKAVGFRLMRKEPLMVRSLDQEVERNSTPFTIGRVRTQEQLEAVTKAAGHRQMRPEDLEPGDSPFRLYYSEAAGAPIGWVRSVRTGRDTYVAGMYVLPSFRRRGLGRSLLNAMLAEDQRLGANYSVLLASSSGAMLYPHAGYRHIATLQLFSPPK